MARNRSRAAAIIKQRKMQRSSVGFGHTGVDFSWQKYRSCELCDKLYVTNNNAAHKEKLIRWEGMIICPTCRYATVVHIKELINGGVLQFTQAHLDRQANPDPDA